MEPRGNYRVLREAGRGGLYYTSDAVWKMKRNPSSVTTAAINTTSGHRCHSALNGRGDGWPLRVNEIAQYTFPIKLRSGQMCLAGQRLRIKLVCYRRNPGLPPPPPPPPLTLSLFPDGPIKSSRCKLKRWDLCCQPGPFNLGPSVLICRVRSQTPQRARRMFKISNRYTRHLFFPTNALDWPKCNADCCRSRLGLDKDQGMIHLEISVSDGRK